MNYRKIWEEKNGSIPVDEFGIPYEIHHIDGDHNNNNIENLTCISIADHFNIHYNQGDHLAALLIATRINNYVDGKYDKELLSEISKRSNKARIKAGTHNFLNDLHRENNRQVQQNLYSAGKHHFCEGQSDRGKKSHAKRVERWQTLLEEDFLNLIKTYNFYVIKKLRNGNIDKVINGIIIQAINARYTSNDEKNIFYNKLIGYHNVNEAYLFADEQVKNNRRRRRERTAKRS
jgi:hypothetical protein